MSHENFRTFGGFFIIFPLPPGFREGKEGEGEGGRRCMSFCFVFFFDIWILRVAM